MSRNPIKLMRRLATLATVIAVIGGGSLAGAVAPADAKTKVVAVANKSLPTISGTAKVGSTLTGSVGKWTGTPKFLYQWVSCTTAKVNMNNVESCVLLDSGNHKTYKIQPADSGTYIVLAVAAFDGKQYIYALSKATKKVVGKAVTIVVPNNFTYNNGIRVGTNLQAFTSTNTPTTSDAPVVTIYLDYQCPICKMALNGPLSQVDANASSGKWIVEYHPISFLDGSSTNQYSSRAANAALCVASQDPDKFAAYSNLLFANQPLEGTPGPANSALIDDASQVGIIDIASLTTCVTSGTYIAWIRSTTNDALIKPVPGTKTVIQGTPTVVVNGSFWPNNFGTADDFAAWVASVTK